MNKTSEGHASSVRICKEVALADIECTCSAADMPHGTCCKVRTAFEQWYDAQANGLLMPFDAFKGGWNAARAAIAKVTP